jgi:hypothetical protein
MRGRVGSLDIPTVLGLTLPLLSLLGAVLEIRSCCRSNRACSPYDAVLMLKILVLQTVYTPSDDQTEYQIRDQLSLIRFLGLCCTTLRPTLRQFGRSASS